MEAFEHSHRRLEPSVQSSPSTMGIQTHPAGFQRGVLQSPNLPALWFQSAANSSQREKGWRTISRNKLLPEQLDIKAKIQCAWETVWVSINLTYDLGKNERTFKYCNSSRVLNRELLHQAGAPSMYYGGKETTETLFFVSNEATSSGHYVQTNFTGSFFKSRTGEEVPDAFSFCPGSPCQKTQRDVPLLRELHSVLQLGMIQPLLIAGNQGNLDHHPTPSHPQSPSVQSQS